MPTLTAQIDELLAKALAHYNARYNNDLYRAATSYMPEQSQGTIPQYNRCFRLQDAALAICGSPYHAIRPTTRWTAAELAFLNLFI